MPRRRREKDSKTHRSDLKYKEIRRLLARKEREKREQAENLIEEFYVDSNRMISVQMGADDDLRTMMQTSGIKSSALNDLDTGEPTSKNYVKLAHYHMKGGRLDAGLYYLEVALSMDSESIYALTSLAKCHLLMGHWTEAMKAAEIVMSKDKNNTGAILVKAEAFYNSCYFEHALLLFHRGKVLAPDNEEFRLGIQKCHKTIEDSVSDQGVFKVPGASILFRLLSTASEMHEEGLKGYVGKRKKAMSFKGLLTNLATNMKVGDITDLAKAAAKGDKAKKVKAEDAIDLKQLAIVETILGGQLPSFDAKSEHEKAKATAQNKAKKLFGDAKERTAAKKQEKTDAAKKDENEDQGVKKKKKVKESMTQMMMKAELKSANEEEEKEEKLRAKKEKAKEALKKRQEINKKVFTTNDRLLEDKVYLSMLAEGGIGVRADLPEDYINEDVAFEAKEALDFLNSREKFWDQLDLGSESKKAAQRKKETKTLESLRWLM